MRVGEIVPSALMRRQNHLFSHAAARIGAMNIIKCLGNKSPKQQSAMTFGIILPYQRNSKDGVTCAPGKAHVIKLFSITVPILSSHVKKCSKFSNT